MHERTQPPDDRIELWGVIYAIWLLKTDTGWHAVARAERNPTVEYEGQDEHDFRANALGDVVATIYQEVTPGADNDDHEHDGPERLMPVLDRIDEESDPSCHDAHPDNYTGWASQALWQDLAECRQAIVGLEAIGGLSQQQGTRAPIQRMRNVRAALRERGEDLPADEEP
jgi:hypothetical protein